MNNDGIQRVPRSLRHPLEYWLNFFVFGLDTNNPLGYINNQGEAIKPSRKLRRKTMEIIKKQPSGKVKIANNGGVIFVKPFEDGDQNWSAVSWLIADHQNDISKTDAESAFELATGTKASMIVKDGKSWIARVKK